MSQSAVICVCGAGTMGSGIAQLAAQAGFSTIQFDMQPAMLDKSRDAIRTNLTRMAEKGKIQPAEAEQILARIIFTDQLSDCKADIVIEAIIENKEAKTTLFNQLATVNGADTIFATNTSSISVSDLANQVVHPERVAGMHFFNPAPLMKLVEVVRCSHSSPEVISRLTDLAVAMGKTPVVCKDAPGFIVNRVARPYYLEAMRLVETQQAGMEEIDSLLEATGFKMGPFRLMDMIGMDINYAVSNIVWEALGRPARLTPSTLQQQKVKAGELGRKTGKGFYQYL